MVMIVKDHEKQSHGFISVTWLVRYPGRPLPAVMFSGGWPAES